LRIVAFYPIVARASPTRGTDPYALVCHHGSGHDRAIKPLLRDPRKYWFDCIRCWHFDELEIKAGRQFQRLLWAAAPRRRKCNLSIKAQTLAQGRIDHA
jgi:hypothetical protein